MISMEKTCLPMTSPSPAGSGPKNLYCDCRFYGTSYPSMGFRFFPANPGEFGSFARNEQTEDSDIDILVVFEPGTPHPV